MFKDTKAFFSFSVDDLEKAKKFYGETLGLKVEEVEEGLTLHFAGGGKVFVYPKENHSPATFTVLNFPVNDVEKTVEVLTKRGVEFEQYSEGEIKTNEMGISAGFGFKIAWFTDPAGNISSVIEEKAI